MPTAKAHAPPSVRSTLVYSADEIGASALVTGMALRDHGSFRWADCARPARDDRGAHRIFARGHPEAEVPEVTEAILEPSRVNDAAVRDLLVPQGAEEERRLTALLRLPELFQRFGAEGSDPREATAAVLANVDRLPSRALTVLLGRPDFHDQLRRAGIALYSTADASPLPELLRAFEVVYRLELPSGGSWADGVVRAEKPTPGHGSRPPRTVRETWAELALDPSLLPRT